MEAFLNGMFLKVPVSLLLFALMDHVQLFFSIPSKVLGNAINITPSRHHIWFSVVCLIMIVYTHACITFQGTYHYCNGCLLRFYCLTATPPWGLSKASNAHFSCKGVKCTAFLSHWVRVFILLPSPQQVWAVGRGGRAKGSPGMSTWLDCRYKNHHGS